MTRNPYEPPASSTTAQAADPVLATGPRSHLPADLSFAASALVAASVAVPLLYRHRDLELWGASVALFAGAPLIAGTLLGPRSRFAEWMTGLSLLVCPIVGAITDALPGKYQVARDVFFLATASLTIFISMSWVASKSPSRKWPRKIAGTLGAILGIAAVHVMTWIFAYLE